MSPEGSLPAHGHVIDGIVRGWPRKGERREKADRIILSVILFTPGDFIILSTPGDVNREGGRATSDERSAFQSPQAMGWVVWTEKQQSMHESLPYFFDSRSKRHMC